MIEIVSENDREQVELFIYFAHNFDKNSFCIKQLHNFFLIL